MNWYIKFAQAIEQYTENTVKHNPAATPEHYKDNANVEGEYTIKLWDLWQQGDYRGFADEIEKYRQKTLEAYSRTNPDHLTPRQIADAIQNRINAMTATSVRKTRPIIKNYGELDQLKQKAPVSDDKPTPKTVVDSFSGGQLNIPYKQPA
jgi:hypothetical protein